MCECGWVNKNGRIFWESLRWQMWSPPRSGENKSFTWNRHQAEDWSIFWKIIQNGQFFLNAWKVKLAGLLNKCARWRKSRLDSKHYMDALLWPRGLIWGNQGTCLFEFHSDHIGAHCYRLIIITTVATNWLPSALSSWLSLLQTYQMIILTLDLQLLSISVALLQFQAKNKIRVKNLILILMTSTCFCARCRKFLGPVFLVFAWQLHLIDM